MAGDSQMAENYHLSDFEIDGVTLVLAKRDLEDMEFIDPCFFEPDYSVAASTAYVVWDATWVFISLMQERLRDKVKGARILELGCGTGLAGLSAAVLGAHVLLTDVPSVVDTVLLDNFNSQPTQGGCSDGWVGAQALGKGSVARAALDWYYPERKGENEPTDSDIIVCCDCVWLRELLEPFVDTLLRMLRGPRSPVCYLAFRERAGENSGSFVHSSELLTMLDQQGCSCSLIHTGDAPQTQGRTARVYEIQLRKMDDGLAAAVGTPGDPPVLRCAVFDFDNTLLQSEELKRKVMLGICGQYSTPTRSGLDIISGVNTDARVPGVKCTRYTIFRDFAQGLHDAGYQPSDGGSWEVEELGKRLAEEFSTEVESTLAEADEVPGALDMLKHLNAHRIHVYINSATPQPPLVDLVERLGWTPFVCRVLGAPADKLENLQLVAQEESIRADEMVHVGDGNNDCKAAEQFGCKFLGVHVDPATFTGPVHLMVPDMHAACSTICGLAGIPDKKPL